ncbi:MAG: hypothetical protein Q7V20_09150 [Aquabacterium sp.]|uniref:hypothetical protein n=1 Tax=Aquabacterium sp. TaxID=1872578 RepID=UPI00271D8ECD|nr:hypothetical protein [Aquabacterium sp.]MDO9003604.1 hypothetical protein [Aquabacterium sp.]
MSLESVISAIASAIAIGTVGLALLKERQPAVKITSLRLYTAGEFQQITLELKNTKDYDVTIKQSQVFSMYRFMTNLGPSSRPRLIPVLETDDIVCIIPETPIPSKGYVRLSLNVNFPAIEFKKFVALMNTSHGNYTTKAKVEHISGMIHIRSHRTVFQSRRAAYRCFVWTKAANFLHLSPLKNTALAGKLKTRADQIFEEALVPKREPFRNR